MSDQHEERAIDGMQYCVLPQNDMQNDILPATIFQILQAETSSDFEDRSLVIEGRRLGAVALVAHVISVEKLASRIDYILEDGTGRICAQKELHSLFYLHGSSEKAEEQETIQSLAFYPWSEHTYVEVIGIPHKRNPNWPPKFRIKTIYPAHDYNHILYHILHVIHCNHLTQQHTQPHSSGIDSESNDGQRNNAPMPDALAISSTCGILPEVFSPHRQQPYNILDSLQRTIVMYMCHNSSQSLLIPDLAQAIQAVCGCSQNQFDQALQTLLSEAWITSPLDDGYVILTPRH